MMFSTQAMTKKISGVRLSPKALRILERRLKSMEEPMPAKMMTMYR